MPEVTFREAEYRDCPTYFEGQGVLCWDLDDGADAGCDGGERCRACLCTVQCAGSDVATTCADVTDSGTAECVQARPGEAGLCLLYCNERRPCPNQMSCVRYPGLTRDVCMFVQGLL